MGSRDLSPDDEKRITELVRAALAGTGSVEFKPFAFYNADLDIVEVYTKDASFSARWNHGLLTVREHLHPDGEEPEYVGFEIESVCALCGIRGLSGAVSIAELLDAVEAHDTGQADALAIARAQLELLVDKYVTIPSH